MAIKRVLIANRGEIAIRIMNAAHDLEIETVAIYTQDDAACLHTKKADYACALDGIGVAGYLDIEDILKLAKQTACDAIHPGYGFLSERADFAAACAKAGVTFIGPSEATLSLLGDKASARALAIQSDVAVAAGSDGAVDLEGALAFFDQLPQHQAMVIKAVAGGGGRGMRIVKQRDDVETAFLRCRSEAEKAFGVADLYVEHFIEKARHIEIQVIADGVNYSHLFERDCSLQRRNQKVVEIAPAPNLPHTVRIQLIESALRLAKAANYKGVGTFEFLVYGEQQDQFIFLEANPRLQVEHTVTEELTGLDIVQLQFQIANDVKLNAEQIIAATQTPPEGYAIQLRINGESQLEDGSLLPAFGDITRFDVSMARGTRLDTHLYNGYSMSANYDSLLAKLIVKSIYPSFSKAIKTSYRNLCSVSIDGVDTNIGLLKNILTHPALEQPCYYTRFIDEHLSELVGESSHPQLYMEGSISSERVASDHSFQTPDNAILSAMHGTVVAVEASANQMVANGAVLIILEAMKMEHVVAAPSNGRVSEILVQKGQTVAVGDALLLFDSDKDAFAKNNLADDINIETIRPDLQELLQRHELLLDEARPEAIAKRHAQGYRSARENVADLCEGSEFIEYGGLVIAGQRQRKSLQQLIEQTPADGMVAGIGHINEAQFGRKQSQCIVMSYDYTVMAGTQGLQNHRKKDRMFELAERKQLPVILLAEGGGGRPGDTDALSPAWLDCLAFYLFAKLAAQVPLIGMVNGRCFAGNAALFGCCDITIATETANIGMGGPAMIEGGGLGKFAPEEVGPINDQRANGVVDIVVKDEAEGVAICKRLISFFQGSLDQWECADQRLLRQAIPENRRRVYDIHQLISVLVDIDSFLEIQPDFGKGLITGFARIEGNAVAIVANNPNYLSGAIEATVATKASKFLTLCDKYQIPVTFLCDTPGFMVGPEIEKTGLVRHAANLFIQGAKLSVPFATVVLRKCYGLGAMAMAGGHLKAPLLTVSWPTGEFGAMGLEGAVRLGYRKELEAIEDQEAREQVFQRMVDEAYAQGKATHMATFFEFDHVIDPADTRDWIKEVLF